MNVGGIPPQEIDQYMEKTVAKMKKTPYVDQQTGDYNLKFNIKNIDDYKQYERIVQLLSTITSLYKKEYQFDDETNIVFKSTNNFNMN